MSPEKIRLLLATLAVPLALSVSAVPPILDPTALEPRVSPCQDFYRFACGGWLARTPIPADKTRVMRQSTALMDQTDERLNALLLRLEKGDVSLKTPASAQLVDLYRSCMDFGRTTGAAKKLLDARIAEVEALESDATKERAELARLAARFQLEGTDVLFSFGSGQDLKDSSSVIGFLDQGGMELPEPSYYLDKDAKSVETRKKYLAHINRVFTLLGESRARALKDARTVLAVETDLAAKAYSFDDRQNPSKTDHPITLDGLAKLAPAIDWKAYFDELKGPASALNVNEPEFFSHMSEVVRKTPLADLKTYLVWQLAHRSADALSPAFDREDFAFWGRYLHGQKKMKPRWKRCTEAVEGRLGYALAEVYVKTVDTTAILSRVQSMIDGIKATFRADLVKLSSGPNAWLDPATRDAAIRKLGMLGEKLGAPSKWRDYSTLRTDRSSYLANDIRTDVFESRRDLNKIGKPVDRTEWDMMPWEINAYYDPPKNEFVFPFGILQPPSFDLRANDGTNLGAFGGGTIGHELTHGYDNDGRQYDGHGNFKDWWTEATQKRFDEKTQCFIHQADGYRIREVGLNVDGKKSLTENLADQGGVKLGYAALELAEGKRPSAPLWLGKYTENQQYWIAYAQSWCTKARPEALRMQIKTNPHPPEEFRVNGVVMNRPGFARDFSCKEGDPMAPKDRCSIW